LTNSEFEFGIDQAKDHVERFGFDPSAIVRVVLENKELGLALVQIPITLLNSWIDSTPEVKWEGLPTTIGYYWERNPNGLTSIVAINEETLQAIHEDKLSGYSYAGPLTPPR
jgi:hypothetical protein